MEVKCHSEWEEMPSVATPEWDPVLVRSSNHTGDSSSHLRLPLGQFQSHSPAPCSHSAIGSGAVAALLIPEAYTQPWVCTQ